MNMKFNTHAKETLFQNNNPPNLVYHCPFIITTSILKLRPYMFFWLAYTCFQPSAISLRNSVILYFPLETEWDQIVFWSMQMKTAPCKVKWSEAEARVISMPSPLVIVDMMCMHEESRYQKLWRNPCKRLEFSKAGHSHIGIHERANEQINE